VTVAKDIRRLRKLFKRVLRGWRVTYDPYTRGYKAHVTIIPEKKKAVIYGFGKKKVPIDYALHEILHVCVRAIKHEKRPDKWRELEEHLIQTVCFMYVNRRAR
jgi:hypothetical protein